VSSAISIRKYLIGKIVDAYPMDEFLRYEIDRRAGNKTLDFQIAKVFLKRPKV
jgi:hypothetical protein